MINLMTYGMHGSWENKTGHNSPLYVHDGEIENLSLVSTQLDMYMQLSFQITEALLNQMKQITDVTSLAVTHFISRDQ